MRFFLLQTAGASGTAHSNQLKIGLQPQIAAKRSPTHCSPGTNTQTRCDENTALQFIFFRLQNFVSPPW